MSVSARCRCLRVAYQSPDHLEAVASRDQVRSESVPDIMNPHAINACFFPNGSPESLNFFLRPLTFRAREKPCGVIVSLFSHACQQLHRGRAQRDVFRFLLLAEWFLWY